MAVWAVGMAVAVGLGYAGSCWLWPFARCGKCLGEGKFRRGDGQVWRDCRRCKGSGKRLRVGRKVWNALQERRRSATG